MKRQRSTRQLLIAAATVVLLVLVVRAQQPASTETLVSDISAGGVSLLPTNHPRLPRDLSQLWLVPEKSRAATGEVVAAMKRHADGEYAQALAVLARPSSHVGPLGLYAMYDAAVAHLNLGKAEEARRLFQTIRERKPIGYLNEGAAIGAGQSAEALKDYGQAITIYESLLQTKVARPDELLIRLGTAARAGGQSDKADNAFTRVYYEFPMSEFASTAASELATLSKSAGSDSSAERSRLELARAQQLFTARQYAPARTAYTALRNGVKGDDRELVELRIAEANYFLKRARDARTGLSPYLKDASRQAEALYFHALASRDLGDVAGYLKTMRRVADDFPRQAWAEEALNNLATHYIVKDEDELADQAFRELYGKYPRGSYAERAAWKAGWRAYLNGKYGEAAKFFERAAADFPRSDYRPSWLYWSGRSHDALKERELAEERYSLVTADYANSYYGRLAVKRLDGRQPAPRVIDPQALPPAAEPPNLSLIQTLVSAELFDEALNELRYAQRTTGDSPAIQATVAWILHQQGLTASGPPRFTLLRGAITTMRRAYPQFLAAGGEQLPREILTVIFPLNYWDVIRKYAAAQDLDPFLIAALVAQESTFAPDVRSSANAVGLMQLIPSTARQQARKLKIPYSSRLLTNPEANVRMGTAYFSDKMKEFGAAHLALASYNAGEAPVRQWLAERPGLGVEEFIDDIPYPETQNYVKRILGTAEDYRRLYGK